MPKIKEKRKRLLEQFTRRQIKEAVAQIITSVGVQDLTMDKIAVEAGVAKGTLYRYFSTKNELLRDTVDTCLAQMVEELQAILESRLPAEERLGKMISRHLSFFDEHRDFFRVLLYERNLCQSSRARSGNSVYRSFVEKTAGVIAEGTRSGVFRPVPPLKAAMVIIESNIAVISQRLLVARPEPLEKEAEELRDFFLYGLASRPRQNAEHP
ncbi:MAG: hypothetical protein A3F83_03415 [Candidatus Glassbacteria bacterium RIFCSPLOWO2_12_FULL_58_11]|uniref:HTH tetR-type domain-containing protein n=2 Tax=Candidatus Glassiibacteriota TaxID=1817805 RepID=A0A1F5YRC7_9BACT|nr:MAG: hypothetical protein A2Z86_02180 [Candidatus Glassbacteria bacterium GWA2_58_10]OGG02676.1 MAG: hypothetical protein A3F83_03415 [Candidatus Glassbacteria bacterium RIFCSPLOWO2_12_FULL_58_11]